MSNKSNARLGVIESVLTTGRSARVGCKGLTKLNTEYNGLLGVRKKLLDNLRARNPEKMIVGSVKLSVELEDGKVVPQTVWRLWYFDESERALRANQQFYLRVQPVVSGEEGFADLEVEMEREGGGWEKLATATAGEVYEEAPKTEREWEKMLKDSLHTSCQIYVKNSLGVGNPTANAQFREVLSWWTKVEGREYEGRVVTDEMLGRWAYQLRTAGMDLRKLAERAGTTWTIPEPQAKPEHYEAARKAIAEYGSALTHDERRSTRWLEYRAMVERKGGFYVVLALDELASKASQIQASPAAAMRAQQILDGYGEVDEGFDELVKRVRAGEGDEVADELARRGAAV